MSKKHKNKQQEHTPESEAPNVGEKARIAEEKHKTEAELEQLPKEPVNGYLVGNIVVVREDFQKAQVYHDKGTFGEIHGVKQKRLEFALEEALYLLERGRINIFDGKERLTFEEFSNKASEVEKSFMTRYRVYKDIRTRGYVTKTALKFGADFRLYRRGVKPGEDHAKWVLFATAAGDTYNWRQFAAMNRVAHSTRKKLLVGIVDEEGEVTYYEIRWKKP